MSYDLPFISIIIPVYHANQLKFTINALSQQTYKHFIKEILIVGQQDVREYLTVQNLKYIQVDDLPTPAHNRNIGAMSASGDWLVFTDADCIPKQNWIEKLATSITPQDIVIAGAVDLPGNMPYWGRCDHLFGFETTAYGFANRRLIPYAATLNFAIKRSFYIEIGGLNEDFRGAGGEDRELCWRITQKGAEIRYEQQAIVCHQHLRKDFVSVVKHLYNYGMANGRFRMMHYEQWSKLRRFELKIAQLPLIGELSSVVWVIIQGLSRLVNKAYLREAKYLPGILVLDMSHKLGMIKGLRQYRYE